MRACGPGVVRWVRVCTTTVLMLSLLGLTGGSSLAAPALIEHSVGNYAFAETGDCQEVDGTIVCVLEHLEVAQEGRTTQVCVYIATTTHSPDAEPTATIEFGCTTIARMAYRMDPQLTSVTLATDDRSDHHRGL